MDSKCGSLVHNDNCLTCTHRHAGWFCHLSPDALAVYNALGVHMLVNSGGTLFWEGEPARSVSILCCGEIKLTTSSKEGKTLLVRIAKPGDVLGLSAAISGTPYETTAQALTPVQVKTLQTKDFLHFIETHIEGTMHTAQMLNREYRDALSDATRLALSISISGRVARLFLDLASGHGTFTLAHTHEGLASMLGTTRETVTRVLGELKRKKIIDIEGKAVTIRRIDALELLA